MLGLTLMTSPVFKPLSSISQLNSVQKPPHSLEAAQLFFSRANQLPGRTDFYSKTYVERHPSSKIYRERPPLDSVHISSKIYCYICCPALYLAFGLVNDDGKMKADEVEAQELLQSGDGWEEGDVT